MDLTPHEEKILAIIKKHPKVISDPEIRRQVAEKNNFTYTVFFSELRYFLPHYTANNKEQYSEWEIAKYLNINSAQI